MLGKAIKDARKANYMELLKGIGGRHANSNAVRGEFLKRTGFGLGVGTIGLSALATAKDSLVDPVIQSAKVEISRRQMNDVNPSLKHEDQKMVRNYFNVVKQFSPKAAANPLVAGALVNKMIQFGGVDHKLVQDLTKIQKDSLRTNDNIGVNTLAGSVGGMIG